MSVINSYFANSSLSDTPKNYGVFDYTSNKVMFVGSLSECYGQLEHCAGFGIYSRLTGRNVALRTPSGFCLPKRFLGVYPQIERRLLAHSNWY